MFIDIKPTTTLAALTHNNTSAADSFAGLSNNVAKPVSVSDTPLGIPQKFMMHDVMWWDELGKSHIHIGYSSNDPAYIARKIAAYKRQGIAGGNWLNNGPGGFQDKAALASKPLFEAAALKFSLMISSTVPTLKNATSVASRTSAMNTLLDYYRANYFKSPSYDRWNGRPLLYCFGLANGDYDWTAVRTHVHAWGADEVAFAFRMEEGWGAHLCADLYFPWTHFSESWITFAKKFGKPLMGAANGGFNNSLAPWGTPQVIPQNGGLRFQDELAINRAHSELVQVLGVTGTDYEEGSALEPGLASGVTIGLELSSGVLNWNGGPMFAHYDVLVSADGENFMPLTRSQIPMLVDLDELEFKPGIYYFAVLATGKPFVQNVVSNVIKANLGWAPAP